MRIYLGEMELPAAPERLEVERQGGWESAVLAEAGEILQYKPPGLRAVRFEGIFPMRRYGFVTAETLFQPAEYAARLEEAAAAREPMRLVVSGGGAPFSMLAVIERFTRWEQAGEDGDLYYSLVLREYREYGQKAAAAVRVSSPDGRAVSSAPARSGSPSVPQEYVVQKGDSLWAIAARFLGSGSRYGEIAALNGISNANLIYPGQKLRIPA